MTEQRDPLRPWPINPVHADAVAGKPARTLSEPARRVDAVWREAVATVEAICTDLEARGLSVPDEPAIASEIGQRADEAARIGRYGLAESLAADYVDAWQCVALAATGPVPLETSTGHRVVLLGDRRRPAIEAARQAHPDAALVFPQEITELACGGHDGGGDSGPLLGAVLAAKRILGAWVVRRGAERFAEAERRDTADEVAAARRAEQRRIEREEDLERRRQQRAAGRGVM